MEEAINLAWKSLFAWVDICLEHVDVAGTFRKALNRKPLTFIKAHLLLPLTLNLSAEFLNLKTHNVMQSALLKYIWAQKYIFSAWIYMWWMIFRIILFSLAKMFEPFFKRTVLWDNIIIIVFEWHYLYHGEHYHHLGYHHRHHQMLYLCVGISVCKYLCEEYLCEEYLYVNICVINICVCVNIESIRVLWLATAGVNSPSGSHHHYLGQANLMKPKNKNKKHHYPSQATLKKKPKESTQTIRWHWEVFASYWKKGPSTTTYILSPQTYTSHCRCPAWTLDTGQILFKFRKKSVW